MLSIVTATPEAFTLVAAAVTEPPEVAKSLLSVRVPVALSVPSTLLVVPLMTTLFVSLPATVVPIKTVSALIVPLIATSVPETFSLPPVKPSPVAS